MIEKFSSGSMQGFNTLGLLLNCLKKWEVRPTEEQFLAEYVDPLLPYLGPMLEDWKGFGRGKFYEAVEELEWESYRTQTLKLDPNKEQTRAIQNLRNVEKILGRSLPGEVVLFGSFCTMDGYARFHEGKHRVYLGVDESFHLDPYLNVLQTHEFTHVAREGNPYTWESHGLSSRMTHDEFVQNQPVIEHLFGEGYSCLVSELLNPGAPPWSYCYQDSDSWKKIAKNASNIDKVVWSKSGLPNGQYRVLYDPSQYGEDMPWFSHYAWAWLWVKTLVEEKFEGRCEKALQLSSKDCLEHAKSFRLEGAIQHFYPAFR